MNKDKKLEANLPKGFQNRWGDTLLLKKKLLEVIEKNFIKFGYSALETSPIQLSSIIGNSLSEDETEISDRDTRKSNDTEGRQSSSCGPRVGDFSC